jgi:hypothetical protein
MKKYISLMTTLIISLYGTHAFSSSYADQVSDESHKISELMSKTIDGMRDDAILKIINRAESNIRLIVLYEIQEEGGADYLLGDFISRLYEKKRWNPLIKILKSAPYYPQSTSWIINNFAENDLRISHIRDQMRDSEKKYYFNVQEIRKLIEDAEQKLGPERKKRAR